MPRTFGTFGFIGSPPSSRIVPWTQGKWAEEDHLRGAKCAGKRERFNVVMGPFLAELLSKGAAKSEARLLPGTLQIRRNSINWFPMNNFNNTLVP